MMSLVPGNTGVATSFPDGFLVGNGSVTAPTFRFQDTATGFYRSAINEFALASNGVQTLLVNASGKFTIGATSNTQTHVFNGTSVTLTSDSAANAFLRFKRGSVDSGFIGSQSGTGTLVLGGAAGDLCLSSDNKAINFATDASANITGSVSNTGAWTLGGTGTTVAHRFNGNELAIQTTNAAANAQLVLQQTTGTIGKFALGTNVGGGGASDFAIYGYQNGVTAAIMSNVGAWTLGPSSGSSTQHVIRGGGTAGSAINEAPLILLNLVGNLNWRIGPIQSNTFIVYNNVGTGVFLPSGNTAWSANSDSRMKKNVQNLQYGLDEILSISPKRFDYLSDTTDNSSRIGFIAQDVLAAIPEAVHVPADTESMMGVAATEFIPVLVKAIQEQQTIIESLKTRITALESI
jgi:hypothetical protein